MDHLTNTELGQWLFCLGCALVITNQAMKLIKELRGRPPRPANEELAAGSADLARRVQSLEGKYDLLTDKIELLPERILNMLKNLKP